MKMADMRAWRMRWVLSLILGAWTIALWAPPARAQESRGRLVIWCKWLDPYDSEVFTAKKEPGMAVIAAEKSQMVWRFEIESGPRGSAPELQLVGIHHTAAFAERGGRIISRSGTDEMVLDLPDTGGTYPVTLNYKYPPGAATDSMTLTLLIPKAVRIVRGRINGYVVGSYPDIDHDRRAPDRFVEITPDLMDLHLSSQFHVEDFVSNSRRADQRNFFPKYTIIRQSVIQKIERLVELIDRSPNFQCKGIHVLSGYRTPDYNEVLPEAAIHSYHQYGLAVDIIVDSAPADGVFDDVNQNGKLNIYDAASLAQICDHLEKIGAIPKGGIGLYEHRHSVGRGKYSSSWHVHIDVRESKQTRWGYVFRDGRKYARIVWK